MVSKNRGDKAILYSLMPSNVDWSNGVSDWIELYPFWRYVQSTWPGNGSSLFNSDRGVGSDFQIDKLKFSQISSKEQKSVRDKWNIFVRTLPANLHESLLDKDLTATTVRFKLMGLGGRHRRTISQKITCQMRKERAHKCVFCLKPGEPGSELDLDHKDPKKAFDWNITIDDIQYACHNCNARKRTVLRKHFDGSEVLSPQKLAWWYEPPNQKE